MKRITVLFAAVLLVLPVLAGAEEKAKPVLDSFEKKISYALGADVGKYFSQLGDEVDFDLLVEGLTDGFNKAELALTQEEIIAVQTEFGQRLQAKQEAQLAELKKQNLEDGMAYLEENKKKDGVIVTESGLQYEILTKGEGAVPTPEDQVKVDYAGSLIDGTEFDSSIKRGQPVVFPVNQVIAGWSEALQLLPVGSKARLVIPSDLAYGEQGVPPQIPPNSVLVFEVTLHGIEEPMAEEAPEAEAPAVEAAEEAAAGEEKKAE